ncbi:MAG TPA: T9SS type A sorting domain-containing protein [Bacteroidota bacterium]|nr:T9SS type A sorting domain-containing protein [Bacteroidota bacterium]
MRKPVCVVPLYGALLISLMLVKPQALLSQAPADFHLSGYSGGLAPWENTVHLTIDSAGNGAYFVRQTHADPFIILRTFQLTRSQLDSIYLSAINHQFFVLDSAYKSTALDGSFLELTIQAIGTSHYVRSMNIAVPALDSLVREVNAITPDSLDLIYDELLPGSFLNERERQVRIVPPGVYAAADSSATTAEAFGCQIVVTIKLQLFGTADDSVARIIKEDIEQKWNDTHYTVGGGGPTYSWCPVIFKVVTVVGGDPLPYYHYITLIRQRNFRSYVALLTPPNSGPSLGGTWSDPRSDTSKNLYAHEAGHLMGLTDQYKDDSTTNPVTAHIIPGHENDLMARLGKGPNPSMPTPPAIDSIIRSSGVLCPQYCCQTYALPGLPYQNYSIPLPFGNIVYEVFPINNNLTITANGNGLWWQNSKTGGPLFFPPFGTSVANVYKDEEHPINNLFPLDLALGTGQVYQINPTLQGYYPIYRGNVFAGSSAGSQSILKITGDDLYALGSTYIYVSRDAGATWQIDSAGMGNNFVFDIALDSLQRVYAATINGLFVQLPDSNIWKRDTSYTGPSNLLRIFVDRRNRLFLAVNGGGIYKSTNGGAAWSQDLTWSGNTVKLFSDDSYGNIYALDYKNELYRSPGGTQAWLRFDSSITGLTINAANLYDIKGDSTLFAATSFGIFGSADQGLTWAPANTGLAAQNVYGIAKSIAGRVTVSTDLGIFTKEMGNPLWTKRYPLNGYLGQLGLFDDGIGNLHAVQPNTNPFSLTSGPIFTSTDNGISWSYDTAGLASTRGTLFSVDETGTEHLATTVYGGSFYSLMFEKPPGGSWTPDTTNFLSANYSFSASMNTDKHGMFYVSGSLNGRKVLRRPIAGGPWSPDTAGTSGINYFFQMTPDKNGAMFGASGGGIYRRGSGSWSPVPMPSQLSNESVSAISVDSSNALFAAFVQFSFPAVIGRGVYFSLDTGASWTYAGLDSLPVFRLVSYGDTTYAITNIALYKLTRSPFLGVSGGQLMPSGFLLSQNFPNPFNPSTRIQFSIPISQHVSVKIFDLLGAEITTLVNEFKQPGTYTVTWDARKLPSGVYFCRLQSESFTEMKKLLLLR